MKKLAKRGNMNERIDVALRKFRSRMTSYPPGKRKKLNADEKVK